MRSRVITIIGVVVSVVCVVGVVYWAVHQPAPKFPSDAGHLLLVAAAVGLYGLNTLVRSERWHRLIVQDGGTPDRIDSYALTVVGYTGNNILPARAGDAVRVLLMAPRAGTTRATLVGTLVAERLLDVVVIVVLFVVVGYGVLGEVSGGKAELIGVVTVAVLLAAVATVWFIRRNQRLHDFFAPLMTSTLALISGHGAGLVAMTFLIWLLETFVWMTVGASAGFDMSIIEGLYLVALASIFSLIPSGPAYAGTQDTAAITGIKAIGGTSSLATTYLILLRFVLQVPITIFGLVLLAARYGGISKLRRARLEEVSATGSSS
ncbi:MAG: glycosyltransferase 2 family protein [Solirubrobacteraceae bacterium]|nr:glycosyltransferase 2 family protein [Solirubrobacteraceae bacterium]